jgi:hypothetical protein
MYSYRIVAFMVYIFVFDQNTTDALAQRMKLQFTAHDFLCSLLLMYFSTFQHWLIEYILMPIFISLVHLQ